MNNAEKGPLSTPKSWDERAFDAFEKWYNGLGDKLAYDFHFDAKKLANSVHRWGVRNRVAIYVATFKESEAIFSRLGSTPAAVSADHKVTGLEHDRLLAEIVRQIAINSPRLPADKLPMFTRFIWSTAIEELIKQTKPLTDAYAVNQIHLTARKFFHEAIGVTTKMGLGELDQVWKRGTEQILTNPKVDFAVVHERLTQFVNNPPVNKSAE